MGIFLLLHIPLISLIFIGLLTIHGLNMIGYAISLIVAAEGIFAFFFHRYYIMHGRPEFTPLILLRVPLRRTRRRGLIPRGSAPERWVQGSTLGLIPFIVKGYFMVDLYFVIATNDH